jgi:hypothetical protein
MSGVVPIMGARACAERVQPEAARKFHCGWISAWLDAGNAYWEDLPPNLISL